MGSLSISADLPFIAGKPAQMGHGLVPSGLYDVINHYIRNSNHIVIIL